MTFRSSAIKTFSNVTFVFPTLAHQHYIIQIHPQLLDYANNIQRNKYTYRETQHAAIPWETTRRPIIELDLEHSFIASKAVFLTYKNTCDCCSPCFVSCSVACIRRFVYLYLIAGSSLTVTVLRPTRSWTRTVSPSGFNTAPAARTLGWIRHNCLIVQTPLFLALAWQLAINTKGSSLKLNLQITTWSCLKFTTLYCTK